MGEQNSPCRLRIGNEEIVLASGVLANDPKPVTHNDIHAAPLKGNRRRILAGKRNDAELKIIRRIQLMMLHDIEMPIDRAKAQCPHTNCVIGMKAGAVQHQHKEYKGKNFYSQHVHEMLELFDEWCFNGRDDCNGK